MSIQTKIETSLAALVESKSIPGYPVQKGFTVADYALPLILVKAGKAQEIEPGTRCYNAEVSLAVITQPNDPAELKSEDPIAVHNIAVAAVEALMADADTIFAGFTDTKLFGYYQTDNDSEGSKEGLQTILTYNFTIQDFDS